MGSRRDRRGAARNPREGENPAEYRACDRKRRYETSVEAKKAAESASRRADAPRIYVYRCEFCGGWHLTHRKPRG
jgi:hypothetical protein